MRTNADRLHDGMTFVPLPFDRPGIVRSNGLQIESMHPTRRSATTLAPAPRDETRHCCRFVPDLGRSLSGADRTRHRCGGAGGGVPAPSGRLTRPMRETGLALRGQGV